MMISLKPRSILQLTVTGFLLVTGVLIVALLITVRQLDGLSTQSQGVISRSVGAMAASRTLIEQAAAMERNARQYSIVGSEDMLAVYRDRRRTFGDAAQRLIRLGLDERMASLIYTLIRNEALAYRTLRRGDPVTPDNEVYPRLLESAYEIADLVDEWTGSRLQDIETETSDTKQLLTLQAVLLVSSAVGLAALFTALITRPLLQMEKAISQLGKGEYGEQIAISGPRDLISLGGRLEWLRNRLEQLERQRTNFLRHVSHELKTPLAAMQESAALLNDGLVGELSDEQKDIIQIQSNNCQRLQKLIDELLRHNEASFSVLNVMPQAVRVDQVVMEVVKAHELLIKQDSLNVETSLSALTVAGDPEQLRVVVDNLLTNAIKFSPRHGSISIDCRKDGNKALLDVIDEGPGINNADKEQIFEAFYQGSTPSRDSFSGTGLGLAISQEYVMANGGTIALLDSQRGAHFQVQLPLSSPA